MPRRLSAEAYIEGVLSRNRMVLSRAITLVESRLDSDRILASEVLEACQAHTGKAFRIGITGVPGVGKSTFIDAFGMFLVERGLRVAVLAVDPSSSRTKGSILGDKTRMARLSKHPKAYIRPSPAGETLGGVTRATRESILLCEAYGCDVVVVETVGVGQSETAVHSMVDFFLLLMLSGAGDELQGIKKGVIEMADGMAINKADGDNLKPARRARAEYARALHLLAAQESGWVPPVHTCSALLGEGMAEIWKMLEGYREEMEANGWWRRKRSRQASHWMHDTLQNMLMDHFYESETMAEALERATVEVEKGNTPPTVAARNLIRLYLQNEKK